MQYLPHSLLPFRSGLWFANCGFNNYGLRHGCHIIAFALQIAASCGRYCRVWSYPRRTFHIRRLRIIERSRNCLALGLVAMLAPDANPPADLVFVLDELSARE